MDISTTALGISNARINRRSYRGYRAKRPPTFATTLAGGCGNRAGKNDVGAYRQRIRAD